MIVLEVIVPYTPTAQKGRSEERIHGLDLPCIFVRKSGRQQGSSPNKEMSYRMQRKVFVRMSVFEGVCDGLDIGEQGMWRKTVSDDWGRPVV